MATTLAEIRELLDQDGIRYQPLARDDEEVLMVSFRTDHYKDLAGDNVIPIAIRLLEDGELLRIEAPACYRYHRGPHREAVLQALATLAWRTKMLRMRYDSNDGEIRASVDLPLEDAPLTYRQFRRALMLIPNVIDDLDAWIREAIDHGIAPPSDENLQEEYEEFLELRRTLMGSVDDTHPSQRGPALGSTPERPESAELPGPPELPEPPEAP